MSYGFSLENGKNVGLEYYERKLHLLGDNLEINFMCHIAYNLTVIKYVSDYCADDVICDGQRQSNVKFINWYNFVPSGWQSAMAYIIANGIATVKFTDNVWITNNSSEQC
ncbi:hypothetical protein NQ317_013616 [Molorchus minor]|uniref:Uncharacterized protein n=1 Tax=Molorchus minor TaxID=1323400 RepID=A0ABQ9JF62_9CUCU|nr:hypothetical protein NQ317_013616 [Molorchus minor]